MRTAPMAARHQGGGARAAGAERGGVINARMAGTAADLVKLLAMLAVHDSAVCATNGDASHR